MSDVTIEPHSLVMRPICCEYCKGPSENYVSVRHMFGIRTCAAHLPSGERDVSAYMHKKRMVQMDYVPDSTILAFVGAIKALEFRVIRSSGDVESGWKLEYDSTDFDTNLIIHTGGDWCIPATNGKLRKNTPIADLAKVGAIPSEMVESVLSVLEKGVYLDSYLAAKDLPTLLEKEPASIMTLPDGMRVFMP